MTKSLSIYIFINAFKVTMGKNLYVNFIKRIIDFAGAIVIMPLFLLFTCALSILVYIEDKGKLFYFSYRVGRNGIPFKMYKFRSMIPNAPDIRLPDGSTYNSDDDPRLTGVGKFLRKTSVDELPQIINVIKGDMSFIGPRPDPVDWLERYNPDEKFFLSVRPGITGYNQAYFRNCADSKTKILNDNFYAKNISLILDIKIILRTIKTVLLRENINVDSNRLGNPV